jgi:diguanylate cyclase (GGDEF)-like protein
MEMTVQKASFQQSATSRRNRENIYCNHDDEMGLHTMSKEWISSVLVLLGAGLIFMSILGTNRILRTLKYNRFLKNWNILYIMMMFFFIGYLGVFFLILWGQVQFLIILTGSVFLMGALFVYIVVQTGYLTMDDLVVDKEKAQHLSRLDGLTGVPNRRSFDEYFEREWIRAQSHNKPVSLILFDIDSFKNYNDTYGHLLGDECLIEVAKSIQSLVIQPRSFIGRFGGEEFVIVLPETDYLEAMRFADKIREHITSLQILHAGSNQGIVTISLGVASRLNSHYADAMKLVQEADKALYKAKASGRNRVIGAEI